MKPHLTNHIEKQLINHEGWRNKPYECSAGKLSIGVGRNLDDRGLREDEIRLMLANDIQEAEQELSSQDWAKGHCQSRWFVLVDMCFNLGLPRLLGFKKMVEALYNKDYETAAAEMLDSMWARQVGVRSERLAESMRTGNPVPIQ